MHAAAGRRWARRARERRAADAANEDAADAAAARAGVDVGRVAAVARYGGARAAVPAASRAAVGGAAAERRRGARLAALTDATCIDGLRGATTTAAVRGDHAAGC